MTIRFDAVPGPNGTKRIVAVKQQRQYTPVTNPLPQLPEHRRPPPWKPLPSTLRPVMTGSQKRVLAGMLAASKTAKLAPPSPTVNIPCDQFVKMRTTLKLTQRDLKEITGMSRGYVAQAERDATKHRQRARITTQVVAWARTHDRFSLIKDMEWVHEFCS